MYIHIKTKHFGKCKHTSNVQNAIMGDREPPKGKTMIYHRRVTMVTHRPLKSDNDKHINYE